MEGQLIVTTQGINEVHGHTVYSAATSTAHVHGSWFESPEDVVAEVNRLREEEEGFLYAIWETPDGEEIEPEDLFPPLYCNRCGVMHTHDSQCCNNCGGYLVEEPLEPEDE